MIDRQPRCFAVAMIAVVVLGALVGGCASGQAKPRPKPDMFGPQHPPVQMQLNIGMPFDTDGNGFPDTVQAVAYMFPDSNLSKLPVRVEGSFEFVMFKTNGELMANWVFPPEQVKATGRLLPAGPGYPMFLRLAPGMDVMVPTNMEVRAEFTSEAGQKIRGMGGTVRWGG